MLVKGPARTQVVVNNHWHSRGSLTGQRPNKGPAVCLNTKLSLSAFDVNVLATLKFPSKKLLQISFQVSESI
jgi:hypothetical protein